MKLNKIINLVSNNYVQKKYPISLVHFVTNRCNARCSFCFIDFDDPKTFQNELTLNEIEKLSLTLGPSIQNINLTGGEPFARKELIDISEIYIKNAKIGSLFITSNGSLPDRIKKYLDYLVPKYPNNKFIFSFSIDHIENKHNEIRKVENLFQDCLTSYKLVSQYGNNVFGNISITVSLANCLEIEDIYSSLVNTYNIKAITACLVRDEGVYKTPNEKKEIILKAYKFLTNQISADEKNGKLLGYNPKTIQGRMMNMKNSIMYQNIISTYLKPEFISYCYAGSLFGVISASGVVSPCEVLDKNIGSLREYEMNFMKLWEDYRAQEMKSWIKESKCNCSYECAWSFNILGNFKYQKDLILAALGKKNKI